MSNSGKCIDRSVFTGSLAVKDMEMRMVLSGHHPHFKKLIKSCMTV